MRDPRALFDSLDGSDRRVRVLCVGGPKHGTTIDLPAGHPVWAVPDVSEARRAHYSTTLYRRMRVHYGRTQFVFFAAESVPDADAVPLFEQLLARAPFCKVPCHPWPAVPAPAEPAVVTREIPDVGAHLVELLSGGRP